MDPVCENTCRCNPTTVNKYVLAQAKVQRGDTSFVVNDPECTIPDCGYGMWTGCPQGQPEVFKILSKICNPNGTTTINIRRGLPFTGCDDSTSYIELQSDHFAVEELLIGSSDIHYYQCNICAEIRCVVDSVEELAETAELGQRCIVLGEGCPELYVYTCDGWKSTSCGGELYVKGLFEVCTEINPNDPPDANADTIYQVWNRDLLLGTVTIPGPAPTGSEWVVQVSMHCAHFTEDFTGIDFDVPAKCGIRPVVNGEINTISANVGQTDAEVTHNYGPGDHADGDLSTTAIYRCPQSGSFDIVCQNEFNLRQDAGIRHTIQFCNHAEVLLYTRKLDPAI